MYPSRSPSGSFSIHLYIILFGSQACCLFFLCHKFSVFFCLFLLSPFLSHSLSVSLSVSSLPLLLPSLISSQFLPSSKVILLLFLCTINPQPFPSPPSFILFYFYLFLFTLSGIIFYSPSFSPSPLPLFPTLAHCPSSLDLLQMLLFPTVIWI